MSAIAAGIDKLAALCDEAANSGWATGTLPAIDGSPDRFRDVARTLARLRGNSATLGLTKMDWNNNTLYKKLPVTLVYSKLFADIVQQNPSMVDTVYDFRSFM